MSRKIICLSLFCFLTGCADHARTVPLSKNLLTLGVQEIVLVPEAPLYRTRHAVSIRMEPLDSWNIEPPFQHIRLADGTTTSIKAILVTDRGIRIESANMGSAGDSLDLRFKNGPARDDKIVEIEISASQPIEVTNIRWVDWTPK
jgi:hypothetical protein